ncbi:MAG: hypothetical protein CMC81_07460 [Flavobacteriaceae bacterium]|nr:hypothetical protein [Flavobacteriaceae bacterium]|tara:strand:+ start:1005 stop:1436 length:432 start_codon:yes stop_codon:yes gene_type:complete
MNEFEILTISQAQFQQNATYTIAIFILLAINFYLVRRSRELNFPTYGKVMVSFFSLISVYGGIQVATFLRGFQHNTAYNLKKLKESGVSISEASDASIEFFGNPTGPFSGALPDTPQLIFYAVVLSMLLVGIWGKAPEGAYTK